MSEIVGEGGVRVGLGGGAVGTCVSSTASSDFLTICPHFLLMRMFVIFAFLVFGDVTNLGWSCGSYSQLSGSTGLPARNLTSCASISSATSITGRDDSVTTDDDTVFSVATLVEELAHLQRWVTHSALERESIVM